MAFEFVPSPSVPINTPMEPQPFDFGQWMAQQGQQLKTNVAPLFAGDPKGNAALGSLLGGAAQAIAPEGSWQQKLGAMGQKVGQTAASKGQTQGQGGGPTTAPLTATNDALTKQVQGASTPVPGAPQTPSELLALGQTAAGSTTPSVAPVGSAAMTAQRSAVGPVPGRAPEALPVNMNPTSPGPVVPGAPRQPMQPGTPQAPVVPGMPQAGAPPANFQQAPASVPSLEAQVPSAIGPDAGASTDLLSIGLGDPKLFQDNYKMISDARSKEMAGTANLGQGFEAFRKGQISYPMEKFGGDLLNTQRTLENTVRHGQVMDDMASNDIGRIEARSREYDQMPLNPTMQKKFGVQSWGQLMRMNPQAIQAYGAQLHWDAQMASVREQAAGRMQGHDHMMWMATQKDLANYADKYTPQEWAELQMKDPNKARSIVDAYSLKGQSPVMTSSEVSQYEMSNKQMDALSTKLGLQTGYADRARRMALEASSPPLNEAAFRHQKMLEEQRRRTAGLSADAVLFKKYEDAYKMDPRYAPLFGQENTPGEIGSGADTARAFMLKAMIEQDPNYQAELQKLRRGQ